MNVSRAGKTKATEGKNCERLNSVTTICAKKTSKLKSIYYRTKLPQAFLLLFSSSLRYFFAIFVGLFWLFVPVLLFSGSSRRVVIRKCYLWTLKIFISKSDSVVNLLPIRFCLTTLSRREWIEIESKVFRPFMFFFVAFGFVCHFSMKWCQVFAEGNRRKRTNIYSFMRHVVPKVLDVQWIRCKWMNLCRRSKCWFFVGIRRFATVQNSIDFVVEMSEVWALLLFQIFNRLIELFGYCIECRKFRYYIFIILKLLIEIVLIEASYTFPSALGVSDLSLTKRKLSSN